MYLKGRLVDAEFESRPNRFLGIAKVGGRKVRCFIPSPGRMRELLFRGSKVVLLEADGGDRRTRYDLIGVRLPHANVLIDSRIPNRLLLEVLRDRTIPIGIRYHEVIPEPTVGKSRFDFELRNRERVLVEAKAVTLVEENVALFPDAPTSRGTRHLNELAQLKRKGTSAAVIFVIQREDARAFSPNDRTDPAFGQALRKAVDVGVKAYAFSCKWMDNVVRLGVIVELRLGY